MTTFLPGRSLTVALIAVEARLTGALAAELERQLRLIAEINLIRVNSIEDLATSVCDLAVVNALGVRQEIFDRWVGSFERRIAEKGMIAMPVLFVADAPPAVVRDLFGRAFASNWYFDIVAPEHLDSISLRVANLLRIMSHIAELKRYEDMLKGMSDKIAELESDLVTMASALAKGT